ncbi:hypothetical protein TNCV_4666571 [Trichonephila clavipes]|nr:hypothetical protein TNCV_4666571 [Trichonephila clavipes]
MVSKHITCVLRGASTDTDMFIKILLKERYSSEKTTWCQPTFIDGCTTLTARPFAAVSREATVMVAMLLQTSSPCPCGKQVYFLTQDP